MSIIIFFGIALIIFLTGVAVVSVTLYHWYKLKKENKNLPAWKDLKQTEG